jgi:hypothetical protein
MTFSHLPEELIMLGALIIGLRKLKSQGPIPWLKITLPGVVTFVILMAIAFIHWR